MIRSSGWFEKAMKLAAVSGMRAGLGPALVATAQRRPEGQSLALAALGEMALDKMPLVPSSSSVIMLIPRALAGAWVVKEVMEEEGTNDPWAPAVGAAVAVGIGTLAPIVRGTLRRVLGVPDTLLSLGEDYLAVRLGSEAVGLSTDELKNLAIESIEPIRDRLEPALQSIGAGSM